jgi:ATP-dependent Clp protease ATP-binding subunit ClpA
VIDPLATKLLSGEFGPGDHIAVDVSGDELTFHKHARGAAA